MPKAITNQLIENISKILSEHLTGSKITTLFTYLGFKDFDFILSRPNASTKWKRLNETLTYECKTTKSATPFFKAIEYVLNPVEFTENPEDWTRLSKKVNSKLLFFGYQINENGKISVTEAVSTLSEAENRLDSFVEKLHQYDIHEKIFEYCKPELFANNYFHAILEASKGLMERIRKISELDLDGSTLIFKAFDCNKPLIIIRGNRLLNETDKSLYNGTKHLLLSIAMLYRNPKAHQPKLYDETSETDAITSFVMMSLAHRALDNCLNVRDL